MPSSSSKKLAAVLVAFFSFLIANVLNTTRPFKSKLPTNDTRRCKKTNGPWGAEDLVLGKNQWAFASSVDGGHFFEHGLDACSNQKNAGGIWAFSVAAAEILPMRLELQGLPVEQQSCFRTHGLYLSNATDRLYAVTHHGMYSSVEIFRIGYSHYDDENQQLPSLMWVRSVTSESFPNTGLNDVVEGASAGELYVTQWIPSFTGGLPERGRRQADLSLGDKMRQALLVPAFLLGLKLTVVHRCTFGDDPSVNATCMEATEGKVQFRVANGISITNDRSTVFINDALGYSIGIFERQPETGVLIKTGEIALEHVADNIEWKDTGDGGEELWMGTVGDTWTVAMNENLLFEDRNTVSGGTAVVEKGPNGDWEGQRIMYNHDGTVLSQISSGFAYGGRTFLGSSYAYGILVCEDEK